RSSPAFARRRADAHPWLDTCVTYRLRIEQWRSAPAPRSRRPDAIADPANRKLQGGCTDEDPCCPTLATRVQGAGAGRASRPRLRPAFGRHAQRRQSAPGVRGAEPEPEDASVGRRWLRALGIERDPAIPGRHEARKRLVAVGCQAPRRREPLAVLGIRTLGSGLRRTAVGAPGQGAVWFRRRGSGRSREGRADLYAVRRGAEPELGWSAVSHRTPAHRGRLLGRRLAESRRGRAVSAGAVFRDQALARTAHGTPGLAP